MGGQPCFQKVLINSGRTRRALDVLEAAIKDATFDDEAGYRIVKQLNDAEDSVDKATREFLESQGFDGPWPHSLDFGENKYK